MAFAIASLSGKKSIVGDREAIRKAFPFGFFGHSAKLDRSCNFDSQAVAVPVFTPICASYHKMAFTTKEFMRQIIPINPEWLVETASQYSKPKEIQKSRAKMPKVVS